jgi:hypothetical protein
VDFPVRLRPIKIATASWGILAMSNFFKETFTAEDAAIV